MLEGVPTGADLYMLVRVLHDWPDKDCLRLLRACRAAMRPEALLLIGEQILDPNPAHGRPTDYLLDIESMQTRGGQGPRAANPVRQGPEIIAPYLVHWVR